MIHFSVDDTIAIFENLTKESYSSCFEEPTLAFLKELNEKYGLKVSMYCFFEAVSGFTLADATEKFKDEFKANSHWLKFGFHGKDDKSKYDEYDADVFVDEADAVYENLCRIVSADALSYDVRLGFAKGSFDCVKAFKDKYPLFKNLYGADDKRIEYYLTPEENDILLDKGAFYESKAGITIRLSEKRMERQEDVASYIKNSKPREYYAFFTHEIHFGNEKVKEQITELCKMADEFIF